MKKGLTLKILNPTIALLLFCQVFTALIRGVIGHEAFEEIHEMGGILLALGATIHLALNWKWVKANYFKK